MKGELIGAATFVLVSLTTFGQGVVEIPEKAGKYYQVLKKRPHQETLFDRFEGACLDQFGMEELEGVLVKKAEEGDGADWSILSRFYLRRGQDLQALGALAKAIEKSPKDAVLLVERALIHSRRLNFKLATADLEKARQGDDEVIVLRASKLLGRTYVRMGNLEKASQVWNETLEANPGDTDLLEDLVEIAAAEGDPEQGLVFLEKLQKATTDPYRQAMQKLRQAELQTQSGQVDEAFAVLNGLLDSVGSGSWLEREVLAQLDELFRRDQRIDDLREHLVALSEKHGGRLAIHRMLAKLDAEVGEMDVAVDRFREVIARMPGQIEIREEFINLLATNERLEEAVVELEALMEQEGEKDVFFFRMANFKHQLNDREGVLSALKKGHELAGDGEAEALRVARLMSNYDLDQEQEVLLRERLKREDHSPAVKEALVQLLIRKDRKKEAVTFLKLLSASEDVETVIRAHQTALTMGDQQLGFELLNERRSDFGSEKRFLTALFQVGLSQDEVQGLVPEVVRLVRLSEGERELSESVLLGVRVYKAAGVLGEKIRELEGADPLSGKMRCLFAWMKEETGSFAEVDQLFAGQKEPLLVRFHAVVLEMRGDLEEAVKVLGGLRETDEGRSGTYLRELAEMTRRADLLDDSLAVTEKWKQAAPGDRTAWIFRADLLRQRGDLKAAIRELRLATARFDEDVDLKARLAGLFREGGEYRESESLFWRLYSDSKTDEEQMRWSRELAKTAIESGNTDEFERKFKKRSGMNRKAVGPLLALAALARELGERSKEREFLVKAVRLRPKDLELYRRIAEIDKEEGGFSKAIAVLESALPYDENHQIRRSLVDSYLVEGEVDQALASIRLLEAQTEQTTKNVVTLAEQLSQKGFHEEAIQLLIDRRAKGGGEAELDFILADLLIQDGRDGEAIEVLVDLALRPGRNHPKKSATGQGYVWSVSQYMKGHPQEVIEFYEFFRIINMANYSAASFTQSISTLNDRQMKFVAFVKLAKIIDHVEEEKGSEIKKLLKTLDLERSDLFWELATAKEPQEAFMKFVKEHPDDLVTTSFRLSLLLYGGGANLDQSIEPLSSEELRSLCRDSRYGWVAKWPALTELLEGDNVQDGDYDQLIQVYKEEADAFLKELMLRTIMGELLDKKASSEKLQVMEGLVRDVFEDGESQHSSQIRFQARLAVLGKAKIGEILNLAVKEFRDESRGKRQMNVASPLSPMGMSIRQSGAGHQWTFESIPFKSLPQWLTSSDIDGSLYGRGGSMIIALDRVPIPEFDTIDYLDEIESPVLRAIVRYHDGQPLGQELGSGLELKRKEMKELLMLNLVSRLEKGGGQGSRKGVYELASQARSYWVGDQSRVKALELLMLQTSVDLPKEKIKGYETELRALIWKNKIRQIGQDQLDLLKIAKQLGFDDLAERIESLKKARAKQVKGRSSISSNPSVLRLSSKSIEERVKELAKKGKHEAAAKLVWADFRKKAQNRSSMVVFGSGEDWMKKIEDEVVKELLQLAHPGTSKGRMRRMQFVELCLKVGEKEKAIGELQKIHQDRPKDSEVLLKLIFLGGFDDEKATDLLADLIRRQSDEVARYVSNGNMDFDRMQSDKLFQLIELIERSLAKCSPEKAKDVNLSWVNYQGRQFFDYLYASSLPSLLEKGSSGRDSKKIRERREELARRLAKQMMRFPQTMEAAFRLMSVWEDSGFSDSEKLSLAVEILMKEKSAHRWGDVTFALVIAGSWSSGENLEGAASGSFLIGKLDSARSLEEVFQPELLERISQKNKPLLDLLAQLVSVQTIEEGKAFYESRKKLSLPGSALLAMDEILVGKLKGKTGLFALFRENEVDGSQNFGFSSGDSTNKKASLMLKAAASDPDYRAVDQGVRLLRKRFFGSKTSWKSIVNQQPHLLHQYATFVGKLGLSAEEKQKVYGAAFRAGVPMSLTGFWMSNQSLVSHFDQKFENADQVISFFENSGLLLEVGQWTPPGGIHVVDEDTKIGKGKTVLKSSVMLEKAIFFMLSRKLKKDLKKEVMERLERRKDGRFGAKMILAAMVLGEGREKKVAEAFAGEEPEAILGGHRQFVKFAASWLSEEDRKNLPAEVLNFINKSEKK